MNVFGRKAHTSDGQVNAIGERLRLDLRICVDVDIVAVKFGADTSDSIDCDEDLGLLCVRVKEL